MVHSSLIKPLIEPLIKPLVQSRVGRRTALASSAFCATALCLTALAAVTTQADATPRKAAAECAERAKPNAHKLGVKRHVTLSDLLRAAALTRREDDLVSAPAAAAPFDDEALREDRLRCRQRPSPGGGGGLDLARRLDRVLPSRERSAFLLFGSGLPRAALPTAELG